MDNFLNNLTVVIHNSTAARNPFLVAVETSISALLTISALVGNSLVCLAIYRNPSLRTVTNTFVLSLAIADFVTGLLIMPFNTASIITTNWITGAVGCEFNFHCVNLFTAISLMTIMLVAVNRYVRVVRSAVYPKIFSKTNTTVMAIGVWILQGLITSVSYFIRGNTGDEAQTFHVYPASCYQLFTEEGPQKWYAIVGGAYVAVPSAVTVTCYVKIYQKLRHHNAAAAPSTQVEHSAYGVKEAMITKMLGSVVLGFYLCWFPSFAYTIVAAVITFEEYVYKDFFNFITIPMLTSSVINPLVYTLFSRAFRKEFSRIIRFQGTS